MKHELNNYAISALSTLIILQIVMLLSLYSRTFPHPPETVAPFAIAPFLAVSLSFAAVALILGPTRNQPGRSFAILAGLSALVSFGPQKFFDAQIGFVWPAVVIGQIAVISLVATLWLTHKTRDGTGHRQQVG
ncbi:hypothetical protein [Roseovarius phycicola]|uniref:Uncharacterized protein n=1 Tax=Roseovarius phycicola TaxID=3080976 RepID=A0ABZ2HEI4_9RHOB